MADFAELIAMLTNPGEDGVPDSIYDDLSASYTDATSTRDAKIGESDSLIAELQAEISRVKSMNYDLMIAAVADTGDGDDNGSDAPQDNAADIGDDDDFFTDKD